MKKSLFSIYIALFFLICTIPAAGMFLAEQEEVRANQMLAQKPVLKEKSEWNPDYLRELDQYVSDHFAFRQEMITANAVLMSGLFHVSGTEDVLLGRGGWLFYRETINDFSGIATMSERRLYAAARNLYLMQEAAEKQGKTFLFTIAPNKNSIYPEYMPYYVRKTDEQGNASRFIRHLRQQKVRYIDLFQPLKNDTKVLYHRLDSHWTNEGASLAGEVLLDAVKKKPDCFPGKKTYRKQDFPGDLYEMVYPKGNQKDWEVYYRRPFTFQYKEPFGGVTDITIKTTNKDKEGSLLMYRDSFGNALIPFMAEAFSEACFSRQSQYDLTVEEAEEAEIVILEMVERNIPQLAFCQPIFAAPEREQGLRLEEQRAASFTMEQENWNQELVKLSGSFKHCRLDADSNIYVRIGNKCYEATPVSETREKEGYVLYVQKKKLSEKQCTVQIVYKSKDRYVRTEEKVIQFGGN